MLCLVTQSCQTFCNPMDCSWPGYSVHGDSPGKNTGVGCHALLQGIFPTQESNPGLLHCRWTLYHLSHQGSTWILEWVAYPFSRGRSWPRNWIWVSCIAGGFFTGWATREALLTHQIRSDQSLSHVQLFAAPWIAERQACLFITNSWSSPRPTSIESVMPSSHLIS